MTHAAPKADVILAEDEPELRGLLIERLAMSGLYALPAADGEQALALLALHPSVPLLLSDIRMPRMDGHTLVAAALRLRPELKVLLMTGHHTEAPREPALRARELRTLFKPFSLDRMVGVVQEMLARP
jgi:DNA-binding NtrC family response regulator